MTPTITTHTRWLVLVAVALMALAAVLPNAATAEPMKVAWIQATCAVDPGDTWTGAGGRRLHLRSEVHRDVMMWPDGTAFGTNTIVFDFDVKLKNGRGFASGTFNARPSGLATGCWIGTFDGTLRKFMLSAKVKGHGTGDLAGTTLRGQIEQYVPTDEEALTLCGGDKVYKAVRVAGTIRGLDGT